MKKNKKVRTLVINGMRLKFKQVRADFVGLFDADGLGVSFKCMGENLVRRYIHWRLPYGQNAYANLHQELRVVRMDRSLTKFQSGVNRR